MGDQASAMEDLSSEFAGALQVAAVGLAAASASLLSQVPVVGQLFDSLFAVVQAVAFQMDNVLRPVLGPISEGFFNLAGAISGLEGPVGTVVGILGTLVAAASGVVGAIVGLNSVGLTSIGILAGLKSIAAVVGGALATLAGAISLPAVAVAALAVAIGTALAVILTDFRGLRTKAIDIITDWVGSAVDLVSEFISDIVSFGSKIFRAGVGLINSFIDGIKNRASALLDTVRGIMSDVRDFFPFSPAETGPLSDLDQTGPALINEFATGINSERKQATSATGSAMGSSGGNSRLPRARNTTTKLFIDGREAGRGTQKERFDESARRGQTF